MATTPPRGPLQDRGDRGFSRGPASRLTAPSLTRREREVLALLRHRLTDREIADHLGIGVRSAKSHVASILAKLRTENRRTAGTLAALA